MSWAKLPNQWILAEDPERTMPLLPGSTRAHFVAPGDLVAAYLLRRLSWREHRASAWAAAFMMPMLACRLNDENRKRLTDAAQRDDSDALPTTGRVAVTYDDFEEQLGVARQTIRKAIDLLKELGAVHVEVHGRRNVFELQGIQESGKWCQLPVEQLRSNGRDFGRLSLLKPNLVGLNALKIYLVMLALRNFKTGTTAIGYTKLEERTGIRRSDLPAALSALATSELLGVSHDPDARSDTDLSRRYVVRGLARPDR